MTVSSLAPVNNYTGNNSARTFDFDFLIENEQELKVSILNLDTNTTTELLLGVDYSINEVGNKNGSYITFPLQNSSFGVLQENQIISLNLFLPIKQESVFENSADLKLDVLEWTFDYIVRILQVLNRQVERAIKIREGETFSSCDELVASIYEHSNKVEQNLEIVSHKAAETLQNAQNTLIALEKVENKANNNLDNLTDDGINLIKGYIGKGQPIGTVFPLNCSSSYIPEGCLPCDGAEYSKAQFKQLWDNYLIGKDVFDPDSITVVGNPTITDDGVVSGFSSSDYINLGQGLLTNSNTWELEFDYDATDVPDNTVGTIFSNIQTSPTYSGLVIQGRNHSLSLFSGSGSGTTWDVFNNITISIKYKAFNKIRLGYNGTKYYCFVNGVEKWSLISDVKIGFPNTNCVVGYHSWWGALQYGSIDLKQILITVNEQTVFDCVKQVPLLNTCSYEEYEGDLATYGQCSKFAVKPLEYDGTSLSVIGSPTITEDGIASGFSVNNYIKSPLKLSSSNFKIKSSFAFGDDLSSFQNAWDISSPNIGRYIISLRPISDNNLAVCFYNGTATQVVYYNQVEVPRISGKTYNVDIEVNGNNAKIIINNITKEINNFVFAETEELVIGMGYVQDGNVFQGSIDLKQFSITVDGQTVFDFVEGDTFKVPTIINENKTLSDFVVVANDYVSESQMDWSKWILGLERKANNDLSNCTKPYIIETSDETLMPSWYRIWSDGWCEQGGITAGGTTSTGKQVSLLKSLKDNYSLRTYVIGDSNSFNSAGTWVKTRAKTSSSFYIASGFTGASTTEYASYNCSWEAKGYLQ